MAEFDKSRVYTAVNADELKVGSKVIVANYLESLRDQVEANSYPTYVKELTYIMGTSSTNRFRADDNETYNLCYLISEPEEKKLKWTDLKIGDVIRKKYENGYRFAMVTRIDTYTTDKHIGISGEWISDSELEEWEKVDTELEEYERQVTE